MPPFDEKVKRALQDHIKEPLHHFYIVEGDKTSVVPALSALLEEDFKVSTRGNPDFYVEEHELLSIDDARRTKEMQSRKNIGSGRQIFIYAPASISHEAQNALLKMLEEPASETHFFMVVSNASMFLDTITSRAYVVKLSLEEVHAKSHAIVKKFLVASPAERIKLLQKIIDKKEKAEAISFLGTLLSELDGAQSAKGKKRSLEDAEMLAQIEKCRRYLFGRGSQTKMILEHIAVALPF